MGSAYGRVLLKKRVYAELPPAMETPVVYTAPPAALPPPPTTDVYGAPPQPPATINATTYRYISIDLLFGSGDLYVYKIAFDTGATL